MSRHTLRTTALSSLMTANNENIANCEINYKITTTERSGSVVTHETRIRKVPGSNPGADQPD